MTTEEDWNEEMITRYNAMGIYNQKNLLTRIQRFFLDDMRLKIISLMIESGSVIDLGCGEGELFKYLKNDKLVGVELSQRMIDSARKTFPNAMFFKSNIKNTHLPGDYDNAVCSETLEHIERYDDVIKEAYRLLKDGGTFIISVPNDHNVLKIKKFLKRVGLSKEASLQVWHVNIFEIEHLVGELEKNNFKVERVFPLWPIFPFKYIIKCRK